MDLLPKLTFDGMASYFGLAVGLAVGFAIFSAPMEQLKAGLRKNGGV
jgi:hypothetical protein